MRIYISGPISKRPNDALERFAAAKKDIIDTYGPEVEFIDPLDIGNATSNNANLTQDEFMKISYTLMELCDSIYFMDGWQDSIGCKQEYIYAQNRHMTIIQI